MPTQSTIHVLLSYRERMRGEKGGERGRGEYKNLNRVRNEHRNHTSYYFTNFPESHNEEDFWKTFMRWGKVRDMFIAPRRNRGDKGLVL